MPLGILVLRPQLAVRQRRTNKRASLRTVDRLLWVLLFAAMAAVAISFGHRQAGNSSRMAAKGVSIVLALEEQGREVR